MTIIKCENCGKMIEKEYIKKLNLGKEIYYLCSKCFEICNKFKQKYDL